MYGLKSPENAIGHADVAVGGRQIKYQPVTPFEDSTGVG